jgi:hypothetical protein
MKAMASVVAIACAATDNADSCPPDPGGDYVALNRTKFRSAGFQPAGPAASSRRLVATSYWPTRFEGRGVSRLRFETRWHVCRPKLRAHSGAPLRVWL